MKNGYTKPVQDIFFLFQKEAISFSERSKAQYQNQSCQMQETTDFQIFLRSIFIIIVPVHILYYSECNIIGAFFNISRKDGK